MKKLLIFIGGVVTGIILTIVVSVLIAGINLTDITLFEEDGECISENSFKVIQVLDSGEALANELEQRSYGTMPTGLTVLFLNEDGESYYDNQIIEIPSGQCAKQIGTFKYPTRLGVEKTVPVVSIRNK